MKSGAAWEGMDYVDEKTRSSVKRANSRNLAKMQSDHRAVQRDISLDAQLALSEGTLGYTELEVMKQQNEDWDGPADPAGIGEKDYMVLKNKLDASLLKSLPEKAEALRETFIGDISDNFKSWMKRYDSIESERDLDEFKGDILKAKGLTPDEQAYMFFNSTALYKAKANPIVSVQVTEAVSKMTRMEANCIAAGIDIKFGESGYAFFNEIGKNPTPEVVTQKAQERYDILKPLYDQKIKGDMAGRDTSGGVEVGGFVKGQTYTDADNNKAIWNGESFEEVR